MNPDDMTKILYGKLAHKYLVIDEIMKHYDRGKDAVTFTTSNADTSNHSADALQHWVKYEKEILDVVNFNFGEPNEFTKMQIEQMRNHVLKTTFGKGFEVDERKQFYEDQDDAGAF